MARTFSSRRICNLLRVYDISPLVNAKPSQSFDAYFGALLEGRKEEITHFLNRAGSYNRVIDGADLDAAKKVFKTRIPSHSDPDQMYHTPSFSGPASPPAAQRAPTGANPYTLPAGRNPALPYQTPSTTNPVKASSYPYPTERPNPFSPTDPTTWGQNVPPIGTSWMNDNALLRIPSASAGLSAPYSGGVQQPGFGTPTYLTFDPALLLRRNRLLEPMRPDNPFGAGPVGQEGQTDPRANNLLGPWPGRYLLWRRNPLYQDP